MTLPTVEEITKMFRGETNEIENPHDIDEVLPKFVQMMIEAPRKKLIQTVVELKKDDNEDVARMEELVENFLKGDMKVTSEIEDMFRTMKKSVKGLEIQMMMMEIAKVNYRLTKVLRRFGEETDIPALLKRCLRNKLISYKAYSKLEKLFEEEDLMLPDLMKVLEMHPLPHDDAIKDGNGVFYVPGSPESLL